MCNCFDGGGGESNTKKKVKKRYVRYEKDLFREKKMRVRSNFI